MAETNISADKVTGEKIEAEHVNELKNALVTTLSPRDSSGTMKAGENLGSPTYPWGILYSDSLIIGGSLLDISLLASENNLVKSGKIRTTSSKSDFIRAAGSSNSATIQGSTTNLVCSINGVTTILTTDNIISSLTTGSTGADNECNINDTSLAGANDTKYLESLTIDAVGANITAKVGELICLKKGSELMLAFVKSNTELTDIRRGYFFDSSGNPIVRETLSNNDTLTLMSLGWVFFENDGSTFDVTYNSPIYSYSQPISPNTGDYWFDLQNKQWRRYNGTDFVVINRILLGIVALDDANCIGSRSVDFDIAYSDENSLDFDSTPFSTEIVRAKGTKNRISVNANTFEVSSNKIEWNITINLDSGLTEQASTTYYCYVTEKGQLVISDEKPYSLDAKLKGLYHPYQSWRAVASFFNNASSDISLVTSNNPTVTLATTSKEGVKFLDDPVIISNNASDSEHDIDFSEGNITFDDGSGQALALAMTKQLDNSWVEGTDQGGLFTGTIANNTFYYCFSIYNPTTKTYDAGFDIDRNGSNVPSGYTGKEYRGAILTDSVGNIRVGDYFYYSNKSCRFRYKQYLQDRTLVSIPTTPTNQIISAPPFSIADFIGIINYVSTGGVLFALIVPTDYLDKNASSTNCNFRTSYNNQDRQDASQSFSVKLDSSSELSIDSSGPGTGVNFQIITEGWTEQLK